MKHLPFRTNPPHAASATRSKGLLSSFYRRYHGRRIGEAERPRTRKPPNRRLRMYKWGPGIARGKPWIATPVWPLEGRSGELVSTPAHGINRDVPSGTCMRVATNMRVLMTTRRPPRLKIAILRISFTGFTEWVQPMRLSPSSQRSLIHPGLMHSGPDCLKKQRKNHDPRLIT